MFINDSDIDDKLNIMKKLFLILPILTMGFIFNGCDKDDPAEDLTAVTGCMDTEANNYDADALEPCENNSCCQYDDTTCSVCGNDPCDCGFADCLLVTPLSSTGAAWALSHAINEDESCEWYCGDDYVPSKCDLYGSNCIGLEFFSNGGVTVGMDNGNDKSYNYGTWSGGCNVGSTVTTVIAYEVDDIDRDGEYDNCGEPYDDINNNGYCDYDEITCEQSLVASAACISNCNEDDDDIDGDGEYDEDGDCISSCNDSNPQIENEDEELVANPLYDEDIDGDGIYNPWDNNDPVMEFVTISFEIMSLSPTEMILEQNGMTLTMKRVAVIGCMDPIAESFNPAAVVPCEDIINNFSLEEEPDGIPDCCEYIIGCMDEEANNYDEDATAPCDDDCCEYDE